MWDLALIGLVFVFFAVSVLLVAGCERLRGGGR